MKVVTSIPEMQEASSSLRRAGKSIAVVPTMGYLHNGHLSLVKIAKKNSDVVITTIFVNPTQFAPHEDFDKYPRDIEADKAHAQSAGTDILFTPDVSSMYPENYLTYVEIEKISKVLEGKFRPSHFRGVATVVAKLFNITQPHIAVFGQKDAQQIAIIKQMVRDLNFNIKIVVGPIIRDRDGLALSSRNVYLSPQERREAIVLHQSLKLAQQIIHSGARHSHEIIENMMKLISSKPSAQIDYISIADAKTLSELSTIIPATEVLISLAVRIGTTRLIDNIIVNA